MEMVENYKVIMLKVYHISALLLFPLRGSKAAPRIGDFSSLYGLKLKAHATACLLSFSEKTTVILYH